MRKGGEETEERGKEEKEGEKGKEVVSVKRRRRSRRGTRIVVEETVRRRENRGKGNRSLRKIVVDAGKRRRGSLVCRGDGTEGVGGG